MSLFISQTATTIENRKYATFSIHDHTKHFTHTMSYTQDRLHYFIKEVYQQYSVQSQKIIEIPT